MEYEFTVKKSRYPQSYEECRNLIVRCIFDCDGNSSCMDCVDLIDKVYLSDFAKNLARLIVCRNAYWLTAGREVGLECMWKPDCSDCKKFAIVLEGNENLTDVCLGCNCILVFPTEEMRDEFHKVFRKDIEVCREFFLNIKK